MLLIPFLLLAFQFEVVQSAGVIIARFRHNLRTDLSKPMVSSHISFAFIGSFSDAYALVADRKKLTINGDQHSILTNKNLTDEGKLRELNKIMTIGKRKHNQLSNNAIILTLAGDNVLRAGNYLVAVLGDDLPFACMKKLTEKYTPWTPYSVQGIISVVNDCWGAQNQSSSVSFPLNTQPNE